MTGGLIACWLMVKSIPQPCPTISSAISLWTLRVRSLTPSTMRPAPGCWQSRAYHGRSCPLSGTWQTAAVPAQTTALEFNAGVSTQTNNGTAAPARVFLHCFIAVSLSVEDKSTAVSQRMLKAEICNWVSKPPAWRYISSSRTSSCCSSLSLPW